MSGADALLADVLWEALTITAIVCIAVWWNLRDPTP